MNNILAGCSRDGIDSQLRGLIILPPLFTLLSRSLPLLHSFPISWFRLKCLKYSNRLSSQSLEEDYFTKKKKEEEEKKKRARKRGDLSKRINYK